MGTDSRKADEVTLRRQLVYEGEVLPDDGLLSDVLTSEKVPLSVLLWNCSVSMLQMFQKVSCWALGWLQKGSRLTCRRGTIILF